MLYIYKTQDGSRAYGLIGTKDAYLVDDKGIATYSSPARLASKNDAITMTAMGKFLAVMVNVRKK